MRLLIYATKTAKIIVEKKEIKTIEAIISIYPDKEQVNAEVYPMTFIENKKVDSNINLFSISIPCDHEIEPEIFIINCADSLKASIEKLGYKVELI